jgi:isoleucyl-tRNA synthetase
MLPDFSEALIDPITEAKVQRMQSAIETGRKLRDKVKLPMKYPLRKVRLIEADPVIAQGLEELSSYIKDELNCMEIEISQDENGHIDYSVTPDNKEMGQAFGKGFNKDFKKKLTQLTTDEIKGYMEAGEIDIDGKKVTEGMLKVGKAFKKSVTSDKDWASECSDLASVMLYTVKDEELMRKGLSREVTNRIQRLRKESGISIEDQIEIFYEFVNEASQSSEIGTVVTEFQSAIEATTRMPLAPKSELKEYAQLVGVTEFAIPDSDDKEMVKLHIYYAAPIFLEEKLTAEFGAVRIHDASLSDKIKSHVTGLERGSLIKQV